jgi:uncharacterized protein YjbI with pentapeptide repeats
MSMSDQDAARTSAIPRPLNDDKGAWTAYWFQQGQPWRTELEIDSERQKYLDERRQITPDMKEGKYPFKDIKLTRADVEWLLATHENGKGPVVWNDISQRTRRGIDLCGADLCYVDLRHLPLTRLHAGLSYDLHPSKEERNKAAIRLQGADLRYTHLEGANLSWADLKDADIWRAHLEEADIHKARLHGAYLIEAHIENTYLSRAHLEGVELENVILADTRRIGPRLVDAHWGETNLAVVDWSQISMLGDENDARQKRMPDGRKKEKNTRLKEYQIAVRANRQLAVALQAGGLNEVAARFAYRAQKLQRVVFRRQRKFGQYLFSGFLDLLAGYGFRPGRSIFWYLVIIFGFALTYYALGQLSLYPPDALVFSLTSFHGRGFFPGLGNEASLHNPLVMLASIEAVIGLFIEISFIATFTKRFFGS